MNNENKIARSECPAESELQNYLDGNLTLTQTERIEQHLSDCDRCYLMLKVLEPSDFDEDYEPSGYVPSQKIPEEVDDYAHELADRQKKINENKRSLEQVRNGGGVKFAQMWKPKTDNILLVTPDGNEYHSFIDFDSIPHFVVVTNENAGTFLEREIIRAFPVHDEEQLINEADLPLKKENSPTGNSFFIQSWNPCEILVDNLDVCIGELSFQNQAELAKKLKKLGQSKLKPKAASDTIGVESDVPELGIDKKYVKRNYKTDPLVRYRYKAFKETSYLRVPAESLRETAKLQTDSQPKFWEKFWGRISDFSSGTRLIPIAASLIIVAIVGGFIFFLASRNNTQEIVKGNSNVALTSLPDKQNDLPNYNGSNSSNSNTSGSENSNSSNLNANGENSVKENQKSVIPSQNKTDKKNLLDNQEKKKGNRQNPKQNDFPGNIQNNRQEVAKDETKKPIPHSRNSVQFVSPNTIAKDSAEKQKNVIFERGISLPKKINNISRSGGGAVLGAITGNSRGALVGAILGSIASGDVFLLSPNGTYVRTLKPRFRWQTIKGIENYKVSIYDYRDVRITSAVVNGDSWTSDTELTPGISYRWKLSPLDKNGAELTFSNQTLQGSFKTLNGAQQKRVARVETIEKSPSLKKAKIYLKNALLDDAISELENYLAVNPKSKKAKMLLDFARNPQKSRVSKNNEQP